MASTQPLAAQQPASNGQNVASGITNMTAKNSAEIIMKWKQIQKSANPQADPDYQKIYALMVNMQQQREFSLKKQEYAQSMQQQQQQSMANNASGPNPAAAQSVTASSGATTSAAPSSNGVAINGAAAPSQTTKPSHGTFPQLFTTEQMLILKAQISAFRSLQKSQVIPVNVQQYLYSAQSKRVLSALGATARSSSQLSDKEAPILDALLTSVKPELQQRRTFYDSFRSPYDDLKDPVGYHSHSRPLTHVPSLLPVGLDPEALREQRERVAYNRMSARYRDLQSMASDIAHWDIQNPGQELPDDTIKKQALIELKKLGLYHRQRALREKLARQMLQYDNLAVTANRSQYRRLKKQSLREARITEKLEKQQRDARETRERKKHSDYLRSVLQHAEVINAAAQAQKLKYQKLGRLMQAQHQNIEKEEQKRIERTAKQRLAALKSNDEEAYLKLLDQAKDTRITHLLKQTDGFLGQLAASVKAEQRKAAVRNGDFPVDESESEDDDAEIEDSDNKKVDYYAVAHKIKEEVLVQPTILVNGTLKEYQLKGLQWMISLYNNNLNGILADEMGLGKTVQTISLLTYLIEHKKQNGPFLVIVPLSTLTNWNLEFEKWAPSIKRIVYKGVPAARKQHQNEIRYGQFQVLLTTYEYIIKDRPVLSKIKWIHMIIDEGHRMKNSQSKLSATLTQYYSTRYRLILTGTPLQNNLPELWALLNFVLPTIFKSVKSFDEWFNTPFANTGGQDKMELTEEEQILVIRRLHKVLRPFLLRRLKKDVEKDLPDKTEKVIKCKFSALQARLYKQMVTHNKLVVSDGKGGKTGARGLSNMIMQLRKLCNHPFVFDEVENQMNPSSTINDLVWRTSGKFELLDRILPKYQATGHRVLMFFQMTAIMDIMEDYLRLRGIKFMRLDGTTKSDDRSDLLKDFNAPGSDYFIFLLSTRAGGLGLNLQTADTVIIYDSDWNPHQDLQAQDRAHRIGQKNEVRILRLISSNSVEEKILERAKFKLDMDGKVIQAGRFDNKSSETDRDAMLRVMLETAEAAESLEQEEMDDDDLNEILARNDGEVEIFQQMDADRAKDLTYGTVSGSKKLARLMQEDELPEIYMSDGNPISDEPEEIKGRGARERTRVKYDDGLTEEQWLNAVDDDEDTPEAAAARKAARKERRLAKQLKRESQGGNTRDDSDDSAGTPDTDEEPEPEPQPKKARARGSKLAKPDKRKAEELDDEPPPAKKPRKGGPGRPKGSLNKGDFMSSAQRSLLQKSLNEILDHIMDLEVDVVSETANSDEEILKRDIIPPFMALPSKKDYADYYILIPRPIAMKQIESKIKKKGYHSLSAFKEDIALLAKNAQTYNEDKSLLFKDSILIEQACDSKIEEVLAEHPELADLEGALGNAGSSAPTTTQGTPAPEKGPSKLKITFNSAQITKDGGSSNVASDDGDDEDD